MTTYVKELKEWSNGVRVSKCVISDFTWFISPVDILQICSEQACRIVLLFLL